MEEFAQTEGTRILKPKRRSKKGKGSVTPPPPPPPLPLPLLPPLPAMKNCTQEGQSAVQYSVLGDDFATASSRKKVRKRNGGKSQKSSGKKSKKGKGGKRGKSRRRNAPIQKKVFSLSDATLVSALNPLN
jgi:hypothetical protein